MDIPASVKSVGYNAFGGSTYLDSLTIRYPDCKLPSSLFYSGRSTVIHGLPGSTAEAYAARANCGFVAFGLGFPTVKKAANTADGVKVTWGAVSGAAKYKVYYKETFVDWTEITSAASGTSYTWKNAESGEDYSFTVQALDKNGNAITGYDKTGKSVTRLTQPKLGKVTNDADGVTVTWSKVTGADDYIVYYKTTGGWKKAGQANRYDTSLTWTKAKSGTNYEFTVKAIVDDGSASSYDTTGKSIIRLAQPEISKVESAATGVQITWGKVTGAAKYTVYYKTTGGWHQAGTTTGRSLTWTKAKNRNEYTFTVKATAKNGNVSSYDTYGKKLKYIAAPKVKAVLSGNGIKISWSKESEASYYLLYYKEGNGSWKKAVSGREYEFTVRALNAKNKAITSYRENVTIKYVKMPKVTDVYINFADGIVVEWDEVPGAYKYQVFYKTTGGWKKLDTAYSNYCVWYGGEYGKTYRFTVRCMDYDGNYCSAYDTNGVRFKNVY